ncbi:thioredoxin domain-containing protein [Halpernia sp. GG3]
MKKVLLGLILLISMNSCGQKQSNQKKNMTSSYPFTNHLINETSPYLLQHAHNPVNWYPWGEEALTKAKKENKLLLISIGYAACHWCHVMEHESFEDEQVAKYMNDNFVAIKIDREEHPDIDQVYMNAVQLLTGSGGWPLNVIALPDGRPIYGGTYFPKDKWIDMLTQVSNFVKNNPEKAELQAKTLTEGIKGSEIVVAQNGKVEYNINNLNTIFSNWKSTIDFTKGGNKRAPKFPLPVGYQFLLFQNYLTKDKDALKAVDVTLNKMADGGIYDQIGGGFARYSTDEDWKVPHFEKMIYDNSQLVSLYSSAFQATKNPKYKTIVDETLGFVARELTNDNGAFYSSLDADSEGEEGKFYVWTKSELDPLLGKDAAIIEDYYSVTKNGNWENGNNILFITENLKKVADKYKISEKDLIEKIELSKKILLKERSKRIRPKTDDKIITAWNGLMLKGYVDAYRVFNEPKYLNAALKNANFILKNTQKSDYRLDRNYKNGKSSINGFLDDYAFTIDAFIDLYQATFDEKWLLEAQNLQEYAIVHFYDDKSKMFFYTSDIDPKLIARKMEISDNVIPSSNSQMAKNLFVLGQYFYNDNYISMSKQMLNNVKQDALKGGAYYANWDILMAWFISEPYEVAIVGNDAIKKRIEFDSHYLPNVFLSGGKTEGNLELLKDKNRPGQTTIYACQNKVCKTPETEVKKVLIEIKK